MSAIVRLKSTNKVDNYYAYKYYLYFMLSIILLAGGIYCWQEYSKFISLFYFTGAVFIFLYKNSYGDFSKKSNCTHPNNLEDFMHSINVDKESKVSEIFNDIDCDVLFLIAGLILVFGCLFIPLGNLIYAKSNGLGTPSFYTIFNNLSPILISTGVLILGGIESRFWSNYGSSSKVSSETITPELLKKIDNIVFPVDGQKEEFAKTISYNFSISNYVTRKKLFDICYSFLNKSQKEHSLDVLNKLINK